MPPHFPTTLHALQLGLVLLGDTVSLRASLVGSGAWRDVSLARSSSGSSSGGSSRFYVPRAELPRGDYVGVLCVTRAGGEQRWLPIPVAGLTTVDNGCGDGGRNALFTV